MSSAPLALAPKPSLAYRLVSGLLVFPLFRGLFRGSTRGLHHVPKQGAVVVVSNHGSHFDPPLLGMPWGGRWLSWPRRNCFQSRCWGP